MWAHYGNNHNGFAVGFNTVELARNMKCAFGHVIYSDKPIDYHVLSDNRETLYTEMFQKSTKWSNEEEFRFITFGVGVTHERASKYSLSAACEIVLGMTTSEQVQDEIIKAAKNTLPNIPIYKVDTNLDQFGFNKTRIL